MENIHQKVSYQCCFCAKAIESDSVNPCDVNISTGAFKDWNQRDNLSFYCHVDCFKLKLHETVRDYLVVDIFE